MFQACRAFVEAEQQYPCFGPESEVPALAAAHRALQAAQAAHAANASQEVGLHAPKPGCVAGLRVMLGPPAGLRARELPWKLHTGPSKLHRLHTRTQGRPGDRPLGPVRPHVWCIQLVILWFLSHTSQICQPGRGLSGRCAVSCDCLISAGSAVWVRVMGLAACVPCPVQGAGAARCP